MGVGSHIPGFFADFATVPLSALSLIPAGVSLAQAAMIEPLATAVHAVGLSLLGEGATVAIIGGGSIGLSLLLAARAAGADAVVIIEPQSAKRSLAETLGATATLPPETADLEERLYEMLSGRPDVVFDAVATAGTVHSGVAWASRGGTVVVVGVGHGPVELAIESLQDHEVALIGSAMYVPEDFERAESLIQNGMPLERLITAVYPLADAPQAFADASAGGQVKIHLAGPAANVDFAR